MGLNKVKPESNMYQGWVTHTWNTVKGECPHDCSYCYMKRWGKLKPVRFDEKELKTDLGEGNFIFVGSSCDMFANDIPDEWINETLHRCEMFDNKYLFQTKNPRRILDFIDNNVIKNKSVVCTTIETNLWYLGIMGGEVPYLRADAMSEISKVMDTYVTIEPILNFELQKMVDLIKICNPLQVNIGADSGNNHLPEPSKEKVLELISEIEKFTVVVRKSNLKRILTTS